MKHPAQLRNRLVALIDKDEVIVRQIVQQRGRRFARQTTGKMPRIILDSVAISDLPDHFQIEHGALIQPLRLDQLAILFELRMPADQLFIDALQRLLARLRRHHIVRLRINRKAQIGLPHLAQQRVDLAQALDLVAPHFDAIGVVFVGRINLDHVAAHAKRSAPEIGIVAIVKDLHQASK